MFERCFTATYMARTYRFGLGFGSVELACPRWRLGLVVSVWLELEGGYVLVWGFEGQVLPSYIQLGRKEYILFCGSSMTLRCVRGVSIIYITQGLRAYSTVMVGQWVELMVGEVFG